MGTLGHINDMIGRDKENRRLRKHNRERMKETRKQLIRTGYKTDLQNISLEDWEKTRHQITEKEKADAKQLFRLQLWILASIALIVLLGLIVYLIF